MKKSDTKLNIKELKAMLFIRDSILYKEKSPTQRDIADHLDFKSPRSVSILVDSLVEKGYINKSPKGKIFLIRDIDHKE